MLVPKTVKKVLLIGAVGVAAGALLFGGELISYAKSSVYSVQRETKAAVPLSFELQRARDLLDEVLPELHQNIRQIAREEVELEALSRSIVESEQRVSQEEAALAQLRDVVASGQNVHYVNGRTYGRDAVTQDMGRRVSMLKEAKLVLEGKRRVEESRRASLAAATTSLEQAQTRKLQLEERIESLAAQFRMVQAAESASGLALNDSKLNQTEKLISELQERLDVAERTLAHEARFTAGIPLAGPTEAELLAEVDALLGITATPTVENMELAGRIGQ
ncbi:MAG: hypothetical protein AAGA25_00925 [Planctomycetota bacterium]